MRRWFTDNNTDTKINKAEQILNEIKKTAVLSSHKIPSGGKRVRERSEWGREEAGQYRHGDDPRPTSALPR